MSRFASSLYLYVLWRFTPLNANKYFSSANITKLIKKFLISPSLSCFRTNFCLWFSPTWSSLRNGATIKIRIFKFVGRLVGLFGDRKSSANNWLVVCGRDECGGCWWRTTRASERNTRSLAVSRVCLPARYSQHHLSVCSFQFSGSCDIKRRAS